MAFVSVETQVGLDFQPLFAHRRLPAQRLRAALEVYDAVAAGDRAADRDATRSFVLDIKTQQRAAKVARAVGE